MHEDRETKHLRVTLAALTRRRPGMARNLLESFAAIDLPENCTVRCLIVENDDAPHTRETVLDMTPLANGLRVDYVLEREPGIPFGRNRAAREAIADGSDLITFVDDDEVVARDWLVHMIAGYRASDAILYGAPVRISPPADELTFGERIMHANIIAFRHEREMEAARVATIRNAGNWTIATNNWLAETRLFHEHGIWFDEALRFTGGSDKKLCLDTRKAGLPVGWNRDAIVYETIPRDRCTFRYQYRRFRDQSNTEFQRKLAEKPRWRFMVFLRLPKQALKATYYLLAAPFTRGRTALKLAQKLGWITGRVGAVFGKRSALYK